MNQRLLEGPSQEPVTVAELAVFSRFDPPAAMTGSPATDNPEYTQVLEWIGAAREHIERLSTFCYLPQTWELSLDDFPRIYIGQDRPYHWNIPAPAPYRPDALELMRHPVQSVTSIKYIDTDGNEQTVDPTTYDLKYDRVILKVNQTWPITARVPDCVTVTYVTGYDPAGSPPVAIPNRLKLALKFLAGWYYETRTPVGVEPTYDVARTLKDLLTGFRSSYVPRF
jgi:uncharacterized phiE125 gp8 family phage protein